MQLLQTDLFASGAPTLRAGARLERTQLDEHCWIDRCDRFLEGGDALLGELVELLPWRQGSRLMWDNWLPEPRLSSAMRRSQHPVVADFVRALDAHYGRPFRSIWCNYYRDGSDSVAWHGDRVRDAYQPTVAILSLGGPRRFQYRPRGGGPSTSLNLASGDLLVMGGEMQRLWEHAVPKTRYAAPRISVTVRHDPDTRPTRTWKP